MNCTLKLWTGMLTRAGASFAALNRIISLNQDGFQAHCGIENSLSSLIAILEDALHNHRDIYIAYIDFKCAFNAVDHDILFRFMTDLGMPDEFVDTCRHLYSCSSTAYMTPYGPTPPISVDRGTLQGDTLSPFLFLLFMEPLLRWLQIGSRGYQPTPFQVQDGNPEHLPHTYTYDGHAYADDISIVTDTVPNMERQVQKLQHFSDFTCTQPNPPKCAVTGALHSQGNAASKALRKRLRDSLAHLHLTVDQKQHPIPVLEPTQTYKVLGVDLCCMLNFRHHLATLRSELSAIGRVLHRTLLGHTRKLRVITGLMQGKIFTLPLALFSPHQLSQLDAVLGRAYRQAYRATPSLARAGLQNTKELAGLDHPSIVAKAAAAAAERLVLNLNRNDTMGHLFRGHVSALARRFRLWPTRAISHGPDSTPTLRALHYTQTALDLDVEDCKSPNTTLPLVGQGGPIDSLLLQYSEDTNTSLRERRRLLLRETTDEHQAKLINVQYAPTKIYDKLCTALRPLWQRGSITWADLVQPQQLGPPSLLPITGILRKLDLKKHAPEPACRKALTCLLSLLTQPRSEVHRRIQDLATPPATGTRVIYDPGSLTSTSLPRHQTPPDPARPRPPPLRPPASPSARRPPTWSPWPPPTAASRLSQTTTAPRTVSYTTRSTGTQSS
mgnify:CR=1 FL=1